MRLIKTFMAGALGLSLAAAPVLAQEAAPLSVAAAAQGEEGSSFDSADYAIPAIAIIAILGAAILLTSNDDDDLGNPVSP